MGMVPRYQIKETRTVRVPLLGCPRKLGSKVRINGLFHLLINGVFLGGNPLILTFDPNFRGTLVGVHSTIP